MLHCVCLLHSASAGITPQHEQLNPEVVYRVANAVDAQQQFFMGGAGQEHLDLLTPPIRTRYSEVYWSLMPPIALPADLVKRYDGKVMAITGHEVNVVRKDNATGKEVSVPCYESYNHHFTASLRSKHVELVSSGRIVSRGLLHNHHTNGTHVFSYRRKPSGQMLEAPTQASRAGVVKDPRSRDGAITHRASPAYAPRPILLPGNRAKPEQRQRAQADVPRATRGPRSAPAEPDPV